MENDVGFPYTHPHVHLVGNGYRILARGCDLPSGVVIWHLPRLGVQGCRYKGYTHDLTSILWSLYSVYIHDCNVNKYSLWQWLAYKHGDCWHSGSGYDVRCRSSIRAVWSYLYSWFFQWLSSLFSNVIIVAAFTTSSGKLFHVFTSWSQKAYFLLFMFYFLL